jgi:hypothetical protein
VTRRELERKFEIVLFAENARMALKSSANESQNLPRPIASSFVKIRAELSACGSRSNIVPCGPPPGIGAKIQGSFSGKKVELLTLGAVLLSKVLS